MSDAADIRKVWELVEREGLFRVLQVVQTPRWALLVSVPWCRFAREICDEAQYRKLIDTMRRSPSAPIEVKSPETQLSLFGDPA